MSKDHLTLSDCTKADLLWIIKYMTRFGDEYKLKHALNELWYEKEVQRIDEADKYAKLAAEKRREVVDLLKPYDGKPMTSVPLKILNKIDTLTQEAQAANKKYMKLIIGITGD